MKKIRSRPGTLHLIPHPRAPAHANIIVSLARSRRSSVSRITRPSLLIPAVGRPSWQPPRSVPRRLVTRRASLLPGPADLASSAFRRVLPDLLARALAVPLSAASARPFIVENRPGASGNSPPAHATGSRRTIGVMISGGNLTIARLLNPKLSFDPHATLPR